MRKIMRAHNSTIPNLSCVIGRSIFTTDSKTFKLSLNCFYFRLCKPESKILKLVISDCDSGLFAKRFSLFTTVM